MRRDRPARPREPSRRRLMLAMLVLTLFKLVLVSHHDIVVWGYDDAGFAHMGTAGYWREPYGSEGFVRQPVYPVYLKLCSRAGIPQRLAIEALWALACIILVRGLRAAGARPAVALLAGALALFHPWTFIWFDRLAQDNLYLPLATIFFISITAALVERSRRAVWRWSALAAVAGALAANTRPEAILLYGTLAVAAVVAVGLKLWCGAGFRITRRRLIAAVLVPFLAMQGFTFILAQKNGQHFGVAVTTDFMLPGFKKLYNALLAIPPEPTAPHGRGFAGGRDPRLQITRDVREKAYAVSPTFATLRPWLDGEHRMREFRRGCRKQTGAKDEFGAWTVWALRLAARRAHGPEPWPSAAPLDAFYARAADEIRAAMDDGRVPRRAVPISFLPPLWPELLSRWPVSLAASWRLIADLPYERMHSQAAAMRHRHNFDIAARRRPMTAAIADRDPGALARTDYSFWYSSARVHAFDRVKQSLAAAYRPLMTASLWVALAGIPAAIVALRRRRIRSRWFVLAIILWSALIARMLLLSLMDVTGLPILERYLLVCPPLLLALALMSLQAIAAAFVPPKTDT